MGPILLIKPIALFLIVLYLPSTYSTKNIVDPSQRVDCAPRPGITDQLCVQQGCIWDPNYDQYHSTTPLCYFPTNTGYVLKSQLGNQLLLAKSAGGARNPYGDNFDELRLTYKTIGLALKVSIGREGR